MLIYIILALSALGLLSNGFLGFMWWKTRKELPALREEMKTSVNSTIDHGVKVMNGLFQQGYDKQFEKLVTELKTTTEKMKNMHKDNEAKILAAQVEGMKDLKASVDRLDKHMALYSSVLESQERLIEAADHLAYNVSPARRHQ